MVGILFDTNIYGKFVEERDFELVDKLENDRKNGNLIIHNFKVIRDELRKAKRLLSIYDKLVCKRMHISDNQVEKIADLYFKKYREKGGIQKKNQNFMNDLRIIAFASIKGLNIIYSNDRKAFLSKLAQESYEEVNIKLYYRTPYFHSYDQLKKIYL